MDVLICGILIHQSLVGKWSAVFILADKKNNDGYVEEQLVHCLEIRS